MMSILLDAARVQEPPDSGWGQLAVEIAGERDARCQAVLHKLGEIKVRGKQCLCGENGKSLGFNISSVANQRMPTMPPS